jgi:hypothetical protein
MNREDFNSDCVCSSGYSETGLPACSLCPYPCLTCTLNICDSCEGSVNRSAAPGCLCNSGFYDNNTTCLLCVHPCSTCSTVSNCTTCVNSTNR